MQTKPIRVAHVIGKLLAGGVESVVFNYYRNIDHSKVQFDIIYTDDSIVEPPEDLIEMGARFYKIPRYKKLIGFSKALNRLLKENDYNIVHSHLNTLNVFPLAVAKFAKIPVRISHSHTSIGKGERTNAFKYTLRPLSKIFPTHYCACSEYAGKWLFGEKLYNKGSIKLVKNAIDLETFKFNEIVREKTRKDLNIENKFVIGHVGRFCYQKNHEFLIDIFNECYKQNPNSILMLVGEGELLPAIKQKVQNLGLEEKVIFLGVRQDVDVLMQGMDVFVLPSRYEGLGMVAIEAQSVCLPIICADTVPLEVKVTENIEFMTLSNSSKKWADRILLMYKNERTDVTMSIKKSGYEIKEESKKLIDCYVNLKKSY